MISNEGYRDRVLTCRDCGSEFVFTAGEQEFYASKGLANSPSRCPDCRAARRGQASSSVRAPRGEQHEAICANCGRTTTVPFVPHGDRPVYCNECFQAQRANRPPRREEPRSYSLSYSDSSSGGYRDGGRDRRGGGRDRRDGGRRDRRENRWEDRW
jgi:CxxC-x17-CxxC domain-containing protein